MYEVLHQWRILIEVIAGEKQYFLWYQLQQKEIYLLKLHLIAL
jgi:hypothetical protein